ncbi:MAG: tetratricopeptide repeat protein [Nitrosomonadales bacterium]|nr:tetratricopeptide repeat protein [Nitrosomonadales bacterium]
MNLLLDARKKIELALEQTGVHKPVEPQLSNALQLENPPASTAPGGTRPIGGPGAAPARSTPPDTRPAGGPGAASDAVAAGKNLFAAKSAPARTGRRLGIIPTALLSGAVIAAAGGYYVWREITPPAQALRPLPKLSPAAPIANVVPPAPATSPAQAPIAPAQENLPAAPAIPSAAPLAGTAPSSPAASASRMNRAVADNPSAAHPRQETASSRQKEAATDKEILPAPPAPGIRIERGQQQASAVDPALQAAWQAYRNGDLDTAGQRYSNILKLDTRNRDALLGMAAIAQQQARDDAAAHYYRQVLALDPRDPIAHAGMLSLLGPGNETGAESRLKLLLAQQPQSAALHFALGNLYAEQSRWSDAQQSYFGASKLEPDNAQFAFNLAVSLDHLGKGELAAQHYRRALQLDGAAAQPRIDRTQTQRRLNELTIAR